MSNKTLDDYCWALRTELDLIRSANTTLSPIWYNRTWEFWKSPRGTVIRIEVLVVLVVFLQLFLVVCGSRRRRSRNFFIQKGVLAAYTLSSSLVSYILGSMQSSAIKSTMYFMWAICLYILFGCADSITAYSLTDNTNLTRQIYQSLLGILYVFLILGSTLAPHQSTIGNLLITVLVVYLLVTAVINFMHRLGACQIASASWPLNKMVADYMYQEHTMDEDYDPASMTGYHYLVECPLRLAHLEHKTSYVTEIKKISSDPAIDLEKVWKNSNNGRPSLSPDLKDACLSFSLFHLLRRRFFGFECGESSQPKTHDFVFRGLLAKKKNSDGAAAGEAEAAVVENDYDWVFKVIEVELDFMYDFFFTNYAAIYYGSVIFRCVLPLVSASLSVVTAFLTAGGLMLRSPSAKYRTDASSVILDTTEADVSITAAILVCISFLQVAQVLYYWMTIWGRVSFACQRIKGPAGRCMGLKELLVQIGVFMSGCCWYQHEEKLGQYSLLESVSNSSKQCMVTKVVASYENAFLHSSSTVNDGVLHVQIKNDVWRGIRKPGKPAKLLPAVKKALVQSLGRTQGKLTNGKSSLLSNGADDLLRACKLGLGGAGTRWSSQKEENQVCVILTWHIATCYCNKELLAGTGVTEELKEHHEVATTLSKYTAYLVGFAPKLLPGHHYDTWCVFMEVATEAMEQTKGRPLGDNLPERTDAGGGAQQDSIYQEGLMLGKKLKDMEAACCWKILADFWAEMLLYLGPSENVKEHIECLAKGGEFITHLWALLTHAGILERDHKRNVIDIEIGGGAYHPSP